MNRASRTIALALLSLGPLPALAACGASMSKAAAPTTEAAAPPPAMPDSGGRAPEAPRQSPAQAKTEAAGDAFEKPASSAELLAYEATVTIGVYRVERAIAAVLDASRGLGGQIVVRNDDQVVFRVPRARFEDALARIDAIGDVVHRDVRAEDVGDRYRDLDVRLRNARAVRDRLAELLARATTVEDSLKIEAQLGRVTEEIERLAGELELVGSRVAFSKITVLFQVRHVEEVHDEVMRLPFPWLKTLGLQRLLNLQE